MTFKIGDEVRVISKTHMNATGKIVVIDGNYNPNNIGVEHHREVTGGHNLAFALPEKSNRGYWYSDVDLIHISSNEVSSNEATKPSLIRKSIGNLIGLTWPLKALRAALKACKPALLIGESGTGKTSIVKELAKELGRKLVRINLDGSIMPDQLIGRFQANGKETFFQHGIIINAMKEGAILLLDEINAALPDTLFVIHALLEETPSITIPETGETIIPAAGFCVIATMNPSHEYAGTKGLNPALYRRFTQVIRFEPIKGQAMIKALGAHVPSANADSVLIVASIIENAQKLRKEEKISTRLTLADAVNALIYAQDGLTLKESIEASLIGKLEPCEREALEYRGLSHGSYGVSTVQEVMDSIDNAKALESKVSALESKISRLEKVQALFDALKEKVEE